MDMHRHSIKILEILHIVRQGFEFASMVTGVNFGLDLVVCTKDVLQEMP